MALTKDDIASAFRELGELAVEDGKVIDLAVYGGSCLILVSNFRTASDDVDAVAITDQNLIDRLARNDGVRTYLSPAIAVPDAHELFATYPDETRPGLRVYVPTTEYMLAMKLMALRIGPDGGKDLDDVVHLIRIVGLTDKTELVEFAAQFYPEARISGKLRLGLDHIWRAVRTKVAQDEHEPPRYLGRSGPAAEG
jgi:Nucleotidyltransferase of unknown function (DUF6036)